MTEVKWVYTYDGAKHGEPIGIFGRMHNFLPVTESEIVRMKERFPYMTYKKVIDESSSMLNKILLNSDFENAFLINEFNIMEQNKR